MERSEFEAKLETGRTTAIVVKTSEYKGQVGLDVRKYYNGGPTKKGAFLVVDKGQPQFVAQALGEVLAAGDGERVMEDTGDTMVVAVRRYDYKGMEGYSIRKEAKAGGWGKGIWFTPQQGVWIAEQINAALGA